MVPHVLAAVAQPMSAGDRNGSPDATASVAAMGNPNPWAPMTTVVASVLRDANPPLKSAAPHESADATPKTTTASSGLTRAV